MIYFNILCYTMQTMAYSLEKTLIKLTYFQKIFHKFNIIFYNNVGLDYNYYELSLNTFYDVNGIKQIC